MVTPRRSIILERNFPGIVVLCGSTRFYDDFRSQNLRLTLEGFIVLSIGCDIRSDHDLAVMRMCGYGPAAKSALDELHKRKIDLADYVFILNRGGYIGESTQSEIVYAVSQGKRIIYQEIPNVPT
jgi:hypothetical protein